MFSKNRVRFFFSLLFLLTTFFVFSQGELDTIRDYRRNSKSIDFSLNSNGYALGFRFCKRLTGFSSRLLGLQLAWLRHPKEVRVYNSYGSQSKFVYGKLNHFFTFRLYYGHQKELYSKREGGVAINSHYLIGPSFGLLKPIYYDVIKHENTIITERFDENYIRNIGQIYGGASFFKGIDEISVLMSAFAKVSLDFNINNKESMSINSLEMGVMIDVFQKTVPIMASDVNDFYFITFFIAYRFGVKSKKMLNNQL